MTLQKDRPSLGSSITGSCSQPLTFGSFLWSLLWMLEVYPRQSVITLWCHSNAWDQSPSCPACNSTPSLQAGDAGGSWSQDHTLVWLPVRRGDWVVYSSHILFEFAGMWSVFSSSPIVLSLGLQPEF